MGFFIFLFVVIVILSAIKVPVKSHRLPGDLTDDEKLMLRKAARRKQIRGSRGLPWFGNRKRSRRNNSKYFWD